MYFLVKITLKNNCYQTPNTQYIVVFKSILLFKNISKYLFLFLTQHSEIIKICMFGNVVVVAVAFQSTFHLEMYQNDIFLFFKSYL